MPGTGKFQSPPTQFQQFLDESGVPTRGWREWFELIPPKITSPGNSGSIPEAANSQGIGGQMATDGTFLYICIDTNSWKKVALSDL